MFTLSQIHQASDKVKSGADFPQFIQDLKSIGVTRYDSFVSNGKTVYYGADSFTLVDKEKYPVMKIALVSSAEKLKQAILIHQQGQTDYPTFCRQAADAGVEKWTTDTVGMTVSYFDKHGNKLNSEPIPSPK